MDFGDNSHAKHAAQCHNNVDGLGKCMICHALVS